MTEGKGAAHRLAEGGLAIDRSRKLGFTFNGVELSGYKGDTLASALLANGRRMIARSAKRRRPRGIMAFGPEDPCGLFEIGEGAQAEPNQRATETALYPGLKAASQSPLGALSSDLGALGAALAEHPAIRRLSAAAPSPLAAWAAQATPAIRRAAGLGRVPDAPDPSDYEHVHLEADVLIAGGGLAGVLAAKAAVAEGARVVLAERSERLGGRALVDGAGAAADQIAGEALWPWLAHEIAALEATGAALILRRADVAMLEPQGPALIRERVRDHRPAGMEGAPRQRLWRVRATRIVNACGAIERPIVFANNDLPGIMTASAIRDFLALHAVAPGRRVALFTNNDDAYRTAVALREAGIEVAAVIDWRMGGPGPIGEAAQALGVEIRTGAAVARALGRREIDGIEIAARRPSGRLGAVERIACDALGVSGGWSPAAALHVQQGGALFWDAERAMMRPDLASAPLDAAGRPLVLSVGAAQGALASAEILASAQSNEQALAGGAAAARASAQADTPRVLAPRPEAPDPAGVIEPLWLSPALGSDHDGARHVVGLENDLTLADLERAAAEGDAAAVEGAGALSALNAHVLWADARGLSIEAAGAPACPSPIAPIAVGTLAGAAEEPLGGPSRRTPMQGWHEARGALFEPEGDWRRPRAYPRAAGPAGEREDLEEATIREVRTVRQRAGLLDLSSLGKFLISGPGAAAFLDRLCTGRISALKPGRCRYALLCAESGALLSDALTARLDDGGGGPESRAYLLHAPAVVGERLLAEMAALRQTRWTDLDLHIADLTDQWAQIALAGPKAQAVLESVSEMDLSEAAFPMTTWREGRVAGISARVFRLRAAGAPGFEVAVPARYGLALWERLVAEGAAMGAAPIGAEAHRVLRAEAGFIALGAEADGAATPLDLGLGGFIDREKPDFIGKRALERPAVHVPHRPRLVGLESEDRGAPPALGGSVVEGERIQPLRVGAPPASRAAMIGRITTSFWSPTLGRGVALALVEGGLSRLGETLRVEGENGAQWVRVVRPAWVDRSGAPVIHGDQSRSDPGPARRPAEEVLA